MWKQYINVSSLTEALTLLNHHGSRARIIAGGTDVLLELERGLRPDVDTLIDISRVAGLDSITMEGDQIRLGPLVNHNHIVASEVIVKRAFPLAQASWEVGAPQIRNRATVAGNLITGSPANDTITPLMALSAMVTLTSLSGERTMPLSSFYTGLRRTVMRPDEILTGITFRALDEYDHGMFIKLGLRRAQAISVVNVAAVVRVVDGRVTETAITLGCVAPTIIRVPKAEVFLYGQPLSETVIWEAAQLAAATPTPIDDVRAPAAYRTEMIRVLVARALRAIADGREREGWAANPPMLWGMTEAKVTQPLSATVTHAQAEPIVTTINGHHYELAQGQDKTLLDFLREDVGLTGTKEGCAEGECGACTVFLDGVAVMACMVPAPRAHGAAIVTVEGLKQNGALHPIQEAFVECAAVQCGYCTPGFLMSGAKLLEEIPQPTREQIQQSITGNLCRCTGYYKIIEAFQAAAGQSSLEGDHA
jgi:carbon-monoxide dehydrogenase medium subunit